MAVRKEVSLKSVRSFSRAQLNVIIIYDDDEYPEYGRAHAQLPHACESVDEISQVFQMDSVLDDCVRNDRFRDSGAADVPSPHGQAYVHAGSSKVTRS